MSEAPSLAWLAAAAVGAGALNAVAGGGTLLTFPALLAVVSSVAANATSTVALVPGSLAGAWGYRRKLRQVRSWLVVLALPSIAGGALGAFLLTRLHEQVFARLVPWLILLATLLFLLQPVISRHIAAGTPDAPAGGKLIAAAMAFQFFVAVYGGYFGAGIGILMLSALGLLGVGEIHRMNALKTVLAALINGVAVVIFALEGIVAWRYEVIMIPAAAIGGYAGAQLARMVDRRLVRWMVIAIGFGLAAHYFFKAAPVTTAMADPASQP